MATEPVPFEIVTEPTGMRVASNGPAKLVLLEGDGELFKRRGVKRMSTMPTAERLLPLVNELAGELLQNPTMPDGEVLARLGALAGMVPPDEPTRIEWVVARVNGVNVFFDGQHVVVTRQDLSF